MPEEQKQKISLSQMGKISCLRGRVLSKEHRYKISRSHKGLKQSK